MGKAISFIESDRAKRTRLADRVPLDKPFTIRISPCRICDLRCEFCHQSLEKYHTYSRRIGTDGFLDLGFYRQLVDDIKNTFGKVKKIVFVGRGEPILHPDIARIVAYAAEKQAADEIEILTNAISLSHELSNQLLDSGLTTLRISVNGLNSEDYLKYCNRKIDFEKVIEQIQYFYIHRKNTTVYAKIINYMVNTPQRREQFYQLFEPICDIINIENLYETNTDIDFHNLSNDPKGFSYSENSTACVKTDICPIPFYSLQIDEDGLVQPCSGPLFYSEEFCLGDAKKESLKDIWFQKGYSFQRQMLEGVEEIPFCKKCATKRSHIYPEDVLDHSAERLKVLYDAELKRKE